MKESKLFGIGTYKRKTNHKAGSIHKAHPNHLKQSFISQTPNESWVSLHNGTKSAMVINIA